jgi:hypothetical protein
MYKGGSGGLQGAGPVSTPTPQRPEFQRPDLSGLGQFAQDSRQNKLVEAQIDLLEAKKLSTVAKTDIDKFGLGIKQEVREYLADGFRLKNAETRSKIKSVDAGTKVTLDRDQRQAILDSKSVEEATQRILHSQAQQSKIPHEKRFLTQQAANLKQDVALKELELTLRKSGISYKDGILDRLLGLALGAIAKNQGKGDKTIPQIMLDLFKKMF